MRKIAAILLLATLHVHGQLPSGFQEVLLGSWTLPMEVVADHNNRLYVAERAGQLYNYYNGQKTLILDLSEEIATYGDFGLMSIALDPDFDNNHYIYLYYVVDRHHLLYYGTPSYNASSNEQGATISRITRYTLNAANNNNSVIGGSRTVLLGETKSTGVPLCGIYHSGGQLKFALDGTLLVSTGDGSLGADYEAQALADGIITTAEYNAPERWRCQMLNSLNGKMLRLNRFTGDGVPSNPFYNFGSPRSAESRVYTSGLRNPFRFDIKPGTGGHAESNGNAGVLVVGDVGQDTKEEINVINAPAQNFGWPRWEGIDVPYLNSPTLNPVNPKKPIIEWGRSGSARAVINNTVSNIGSAAFPFTSFTGGASIGGAFYDGNNYPEAYHNAFFFADFNEQWLRYITLDANNDPLSVQNFGNIIGLNSMYFNHNDDSFYYTTVTGKVAKLNYNLSGNQAPVANFTVDSQYGTSPLTVTFDASLSSDLESTNLTYNWNFGDNTTGSGQQVSHTFYGSGNSPQSFNVVFTVTDPQNASSTKSLKVSVNNTPPQIISTSIDAIYNFNPVTNPSLALSAVVLDQQQSANTLVYKWEVALHHNTHNHPEYITNNANGTFTAGSVPCDANLYFYRITLTVKDSQGLETVFIKDIFPNCNLSDIVAPSKFGIKVENFSANGYKIVWEPSYDLIGIKNYEIRVNGVSQAYVAHNVTDFVYMGMGNLIGKPFKVEVVARDYSGNFTKSVPIIFSFSNNNCSGGSGQIYLSDISPTSQQNGYGPIEMDKSNGEAGANDGNSITLNGVVYAKGIGVHANATVVYDVSANSGGSFKATVGLDDEVDYNYCGTIVFQVKLDNNIVFQSPTMNNESASVNIDIPLAGANTLTLIVTDNNDGASCDHGDWADARITGICSNSDILAPTKVLNLSSQNTSGGAILAWSASSDNLDTQLDYEILLDGVLVGTTTLLNYTVPNLGAGEHYVVVQAKDDAGNRSVSEMVIINVCPSTLIISNVSANIYSNITITKSASGYIEAENQIINQSNIIYKAANSVLLKPGFLVTSGSVFLAEMGGCN